MMKMLIWAVLLSTCACFNQCTCKEQMVHPVAVNNEAGFKVQDSLILHNDALKKQGVDGEDPETFLKTIDCYVMGSKTYQLAVTLSKEYGWAYGDKPTFVLTRRNLSTDRQNIEFYSGDLNKLVNEQLKPSFKNVWVVGGPLLTKDFIQQKLADEIRVSILPIILGDGLPFFDQIKQEQLLELKDSKTYKNGMVELCYELKK